jgi:3-methyladenine DNA glycosylase/8-oxoguanine DNA glycosylase
VGSRLQFRPPEDYLFHRDVCSYGYFLLAPNRWDPGARTMHRPLDLSDGVANFTIGQPNGKPGSSVVATADRALSSAERRQSREQLVRMLRIDDDDVADFHRVDPRWKKSGRGRLFRSPTFFEDLIKTVTSCNVTWPSTVSMNRRLCEVVNVAFPTAAQLRRRRPQTLRARCGVGYRDARIVELSKMTCSGEIDIAWIENPDTPDDDLMVALLALPGIGPYAAANLMQLLGRYAHLPIDTETHRHAKTVLGFQGNERQIARKVQSHYEPFGRHRFRSYWFEMWDFYEAKKGPAWEWAPREVAGAFTASQF